MQRARHRPLLRTLRRVLGAAGAAASVAIASAPGTAAAQANYKLAPVGGRTTLVGGTGLVYGRDSASAFLNPATVVHIDPGRLAFSVNFYEVSVFTSSSWYRPGPVDRDTFGEIGGSRATMTTADFDALAGSLCIYLRIADIALLARERKKDHGENQARLGLCLASVQNTGFALNLEDHVQPTLSGAARQAQTVRQSFRRIAVGPTYGMYITNALAFGASLHLTRTSYRSLFETTASSSAPRGGSIASSFFSSGHGDSYDLSATLGLIYRIGARQMVALALEIPSIHVGGLGGLNRVAHHEGAAGSGTDTTTARGDFASYAPLRIALGTGVERSWGSAEVNVSYHLPLGPDYRATLDGRVASTGIPEHGEVLRFSTQSHGVVNLGVGGEVLVAPYLGLLGGVGTDLSTVKGGTLANDPMGYFPSRTHRVTTSFGLGSHGEGGDLLIGGELSYEWGDRLTVDSYQLPARFGSVDSDRVALLLVIAGTTSFKAIKRAVNDITNAVDPKTADPPKTPPPETPDPPPEQAPADPR